MHQIYLINKFRVLLHECSLQAIYPFNDPVSLDFCIPYLVFNVR